MSSKSNARMLAIMGLAVMAQNPIAGSIINAPAEGKKISGPPKKIIPKGCKEYFFDINGYSIGPKDRDIVFTCCALTDEYAIKKYNKWLKANKL